MRIVLKIGGNEIDDRNFLANVSRLVAGTIEKGHKVIMVHGGGKEITRLLDKLAIETIFVSGMRYTDSASLEAVEMMLSGLINKRLVRSLQQNGINAIGLSGIDGRILSAQRMKRNGEDIGLVGEVSAVNLPVIEMLLERFVVVLSPISLNAETGDALNVNADYAAAAVASSLTSELTIFLSNVPGILNGGTVMKSLDEKEFLTLKGSGIIAGGMIPKIEAALRAVKSGVRIAFITDDAGASQIVEGNPAGTQVTACP